MFELSIKTHFSGAHHLEGYPGKCAEHHGHTWKVEVFVRGEKLDKDGILIDFSSLRETVGSVLNTIDHSDLNTLDAFKKQSPTSENIAAFLFKQLSTDLNCDTYRISRVSVQETPGTKADYWEEK